MNDYDPKPEHRFTFGLWTVGNIGRDPFGGPVRDVKSPVELFHLLPEVGAHDPGSGRERRYPIRASVIYIN